MQLNEESQSPTNKMSLRNIKRKRSQGAAATAADGACFDLHVHHVESLLIALSILCDDRRMGALYKSRYQDLTARHTAAGNQWCPDELVDVISALRSLLHHTSTAPPLTVAEVHSTIGIIYQRLNQDYRAIQSFLHALWVQTSCGDVSQIVLGVTRTQLALAYGRTGKYDEALDLLEMAVQDYQKAGLDRNHKLVVRANEALKGFYLVAVNRATRKTGKRNSRRISQGAA